MSNGVASKGGRGVLDWPGRRLLGPDQLSTRELISVSRDPVASPRLQKWARMLAGARLRGTWQRRDLKRRASRMLPATSPGAKSW